MTRPRSLPRTADRDLSARSGPPRAAARQREQRPGKLRLAGSLAVLVLLLAVTARAQTTTTLLTTTPSPVKPGGKLAYSATVINNGAEERDVALSLGYDSNLTFLGFAARVGLSGVSSCHACTMNSDCAGLGSCKPSGVCSISAEPCLVETSGGTGRQFTIGNLPSGQALSLYLEHQVDPATPLVDPGGQPEQLITTLASTEYDASGSLGSPANTKVTTLVSSDGGAAPLSVGFTGTPREVHPGDELAYRLTILNKGAFDRLVDIFLDYDPNLIFAAYSTDNSDCFDVFPHATCVSRITDPHFIARLAVGESVTVRLTLLVLPGTTRTEVMSRVRVIDRATSLGVEAHETTTVLVCDAPDGTACDNGDVCSGDSCSGGSCVAVACPQACTDPVTGNPVPDGAPCADADACTIEECKGGQCVAKLTPSGNPVNLKCHDCQVCDPALACVTSAAAGNVCRPGFGSCDVAEVCDGVDPMCPDDQFQPPGTLCDDGNPATINDQCACDAEHPETNGLCEAPGSMTPVSPRCVGSPDPCGNGVLDPGEDCDDGNHVAGDCCSPTCHFEPAGSSCADTNVCNGAETCDGHGTCQPGTPLVCDSGTVCAAAACDPALGCRFDPAPAAGCHAGFARAALLINETRKGFEKLSLKLGNGPQLAPADFGDPTAPGGTGYTVCFYRKDDGKLAGDLQLDRAGQACGAKPCWQPLPHKGFQYTDRGFSTDGIGTFKLKAGAAGQSQISLVGRNDANKGQLSLPVGTSPPGIAKGLDRSFDGARVQVRRDDGGACFEADVGTVLRSGPTYFKAKN